MIRTKMTFPQHQQESIKLTMQQGQQLTILLQVMARPLNNNFMLFLKINHSRSQIIHHPFTVHLVAKQNNK